jgi:hypothetical protein
VDATFSASNEIANYSTNSGGQSAANSGGSPYAAGSQAEYDQLVSQAQQAYPKKAGILEDHHITPQYLGGAANGPTVQIDAAYHQQITNAFRQEYPYGTGTTPSPARLQQIMSKVYSQYPLPPGTK